MKKILLLIMLCSMSSALFSQTYTATIVIDDIYYQTANEWNGLFHAQLYQNGNPISSDGLTHYWYTQRQGTGGFQPFTQNGYGPSNHQDDIAEKQPEDIDSEFYEMYVRIDVPGYGLVQSNTVLFTKSGDPVGLELKGRLEDGSPLASVGTLVWSGYRWNDFNFMGNGNLLKVMYDPAIGEKFHRSELEEFAGSLIYENYASYQIWDPGGQTELTNDILLHHRSQHDASVRSYLVDDPTGEYGLEFKDPWLEDQSGVGDENYSLGMEASFKSVSYDSQNPYNLATNTPYRGVFLNENPTFDPSKPIYSVRTPVSPTVNGLTWKFMNWSTSNADLGSPNNIVGGYYESPVVFTGEDATVTANYKAHLGASSLQATAGSNQRKIATNVSSQYAVYESGGYVWFTMDTGSGWTPEVQISGSSPIAKNPSIDLSFPGGPLNIHIVWEESSGGVNNIYYRNSTNAGSSWNSTITLGNPGIGYYSNTDATPVVNGSLASQIVVVWSYNNGLAMRANPSFNTYTYTIANTNSTSKQSALAWGNRASDGTPAFVLAYLHGTGSGALNFKEFTVSSSTPYYLSYESSVTTLTFGTYAANPSITGSTTYGDKTVGVAWDALNSGNRRVYYKQRSSTGSWGGAPMFSHGTHQLTKPTVNFDVNSGNVNVLWQCDSHIGRKTKTISGTSWSALLDLGTGSSPSIPAKTLAGLPQTVWMNGSSVPYTVTPGSLSSLASGTITTNTTWNGNYTVTGTVTVNSGVTLTITPGSVISFYSGTSLTVNGTLSAVGTSPSRITFTRYGTSGTWNGIVVGSTGSVNIQYANISYAGTGIHINGASASQTIKYCNLTNITNYGIQVSNTTTGTKDISYNTISGPNYCIYINNASATIHQNTLSSSYSGTGVYSYGSSGTKFLTNNIISAYTAVYANNYSTLYLLKTSPSTTGHNETMVGSITLLADNNSTIEAGGYSSIQGQNSFYGGGIDAQAMALNYSTVVARYNWWNYDFSYWEYNGGTVDMSYPLGSDPNGGWSGKMAPAIVTANSTKTDNLTAQARSVTESSLFDESLEAARNSMAAGDYSEAIRLFAEKVKSNDDLKRKKYALVRLAECYQRAERSDFVDFLKTEVRPTLASTDELYMSSLELEGIALIGSQRYAEAASVYESIRSSYSDRPETRKHALFNLANLYYSQLDKEEDARAYVEELKANYPNDALTQHAQILIGEESESASAEEIASEQNENAEEQETSLQNYPNPFNPATQLRYSIKDAGYVSLKVYDILGREVAVLVNEEKQPGAYSVEWNAGNLSSGMYFSRLESNGKAIIRKLLLVR